MYVWKVNTSEWRIQQGEQHRVIVSNVGEVGLVNPNSCQTEFWKNKIIF
jgi:hypothetical protein